MNFKLPGAHSILLIIAALVAISTFAIPAGKFDKLRYNSSSETFIYLSDNESKEYSGTQETLDKFGIKANLEKFKEGKINEPIGIPGTYKQVVPNKQGIWEFINAPVKGIMGAFDVILFVLIIGGFIGVMNYSGAFDTGIAALARAFKGKEFYLIIILTALIALGGTSFGLAEETIAFYPILIPVFLAAGYDAMVGLAVIYIGSSIGTMCSTTNPFSIIIASDSAGVSWTSGIYGRIGMLILSTAICCAYIIRYAEKVRRTPSDSLIFEQKGEIEKMFLKDLSKDYHFTPQIVAILIVFFLTFFVMIKGVSDPAWGWWFEEMTTLFLVASVVIAIIAWIPEKVFVKEFMKGAADLLNVAIIIGLARAVTNLMEDGMISDTLLFYASNAVEGMPKGVFINVMLFVYAGLSFFIPSSSGLAVLSMPVMAPLGDVVNVDREIIINAYNYGMGIVAFITPTGLILASLTMVNVSYAKWWQFVAPLLLILTLLSMAYLTILVYV